MIILYIQGLFIRMLSILSPDVNIRVMTKDEVLELLNNEHIDYELVEHQAVFTIDEMLGAGIPHPELIAKNLFVRDDKKRHYYLISVKEDRRVDLREFERERCTRRLSFASEEDLGRLLSLSKGGVTPMGLLNDREGKVELYIDRYFEDKLIGVHPMVNTATVFLSSSDLVSLIEKHGSKVSWL